MYGLRATTKPYGYGKVIRDFRHAAMMSQEWFGRLTGTQQRTVSSWESRGTMRPHFRARVERVIEAFNVYGPGSYAWEMTDQIALGNETMESVLVNAPSRFYDRAELEKWIVAALPFAKRDVESGELELR